MHKVGSASGLRFQEEFLMGVMDSPKILVFDGGNYKEIMKWSVDEFFLFLSLFLLNCICSHLTLATEKHLKYLDIISNI